MGERGKPGRAALVARIVHAVAEALSAPGADLARERAGIVAALAAEAAGAFGAPHHAPEQNGKAVDGLLSGYGWHSRPSWEGAPW